MNVAVFASAFHPHLGGVEELCRQLAQELVKQGHHTIVLTNRWPRSLPEYEELDGIGVYRLPFRVPEAGLKASVNYALTFRRIRRRMLEILRESRVDVLHVQGVSANAFYALEARKALKLPLIVSLQGELTMDSTQLFQRSELARRVLREALARADAITACSSRTLSEAEAFYGSAFGHRGTVVYNGVNLREFQEASAYLSDRPYIFGIGRLVPQKGFDVLLKAFARADLGGHDLVIAGEGPERTYLESLVAVLGIAGRVHFYGRANRPEVAALFKGCSLFVLPSREEPFGIVCLEAMAAAKPVVASRVGGVPEVVLDGTTGVLFPSEDEEVLACAMRCIAGDKAEAECLGAEGARQVRQFQWPVITKEYLRLYQSVAVPPSLNHA
jgi:glycosyltransferase involved in cell wall biosynthesis